MTTKLSLLYIDSSYTLAQIRKRDLSHVLDIRSLNGTFSEVWSAHPVDQHPAFGVADEAFGRPKITDLPDGNHFLHGRYGRFAWLRRIAPLNAALALGGFLTTMVRLVKREKISVIRAGDPLLSGLLGTLVAKATGVPLMVRINGDHDMLRSNTGKPIMPQLFRSRAIERRVERFVLTRAHAIISPSPKYQDFAVSKGADPAKCQIVRYGNLIDPRHLAPPQDRPKPIDADLVNRLSARPHLVYVGRLVSLKLVMDCIEVMGILHKKGIDAGICLVGDGPLKDELLARAQELGFADRVIFTGNIDQGNLSKLIPMCACALSPLTGRSLTEVAFAEAPIVAYDLDGQGEIVVNDVSGFLVPAYDVSAMSDGVIALLNDLELAQRFGKAARTRAFELLEPERQTELEIAAYHSLLDAI